MKALSLIVVFAASLGPLSPVMAQPDPLLKQAIEVKTSIRGLPIKKKPKLVLTLRNLSDFKGVLTAAGDDSFTIKLKKTPDWDKERTIAYKDVLLLAGNGIVLSYAPDPKSNSHGHWNDVRKIAQNERIGIVLASGKDMNGWFGGATETKFVLLGQTHDAVMELPRDSIVRVFGMKGGNNSMSDYTRKGMKSGSEIGAPEALITMPVFAGVGSLIGLARRKGESVILVYAK